MSQRQDTSYHVLESYGVTHRRYYEVKPSGPKCFLREEKLQYQSIKNFFMSAFLPHGYPHSVSEDYLQYQIYDSIQAFASSITGSVCTHSLLKGVGVGDSSASALSATITWLFKDGVSMLGRIGFAWFQGTNLDTDCKKWRLFADILNDLAMLLDLLSVYFQNYFTYIICISGVMKSIVGVAGGCTRAALTQHQAIRNNMADVSAKDGSQETLVNFIALLCSLVILPIVTKSLVLTWILYFAMTTIHLTSNYFAVKSVVMKTFNEARFEIFTIHYLNQPDNKREFLTVSEVNKKERVFFNYSKRKVQIKLGKSFEDIVHRRRCEEVHDMLQMYKGANYLLRVLRKSSTKTLILITLSKKATSSSIMEAFYQALYIKKLLHYPHGLQGAYDEKDFEKVSRQYTLTTFKVFKNMLDRMQYVTDTVLFKVDLWRAECLLQYVFATGRAVCGFLNVAMWSRGPVERDSKEKK